MTKDIVAVVDRTNSGSRNVDNCDSCAIAEHLVASVGAPHPR